MYITLESKLFAQVIDINPKGAPSDLTISDDADIICFRLSGAKFPQINKDIFNKDKPLMFLSLEDSGNLLCEVAESLNDRVCLLGNINEKNYKDVIPAVVKAGHYAILKTPIDINLAKELNILCADLGLPADKIIMNTDIGGLGYGYEYGYSIMEKVRIEGQHDSYLKFPLFSDASSEALKTKEAKSDMYSKSWGDIQTRARMIELSACAGVLAAGANIITVKYPENIPILKGLV